MSGLAHKPKRSRADAGQHRPNLAPPPPPLPRDSSPHTGHIPTHGFLPLDNRRASGEPPLLSAFRPLPETQRFCWKPSPKTLTETEEFTMIANALLFTIVILLGYGFWLLDH